jgi:hypothetical protein
MGSGVSATPIEELWNLVSSVDLGVLRDAWSIAGQLRSGALAQAPGELRFKNDGKYTTKIFLFMANTPASYRCVHLRADLSDFGRPWGERAGQYVYYGPVRLSQEANFDAFGCRWQNEGSYWYLH